MKMITLKFRSTYALLKHHRSYTDYVWMTKLDALKGLDTGTDYGSDKSASVFAHHIAEVIHSTFYYMQLCVCAGGERD